VEQEQAGQLTPGVFLSQQHSTMRTSNTPTETTFAEIIKLLQDKMGEKGKLIDGTNHYYILQ
jgi:hypothetical protein